MVQVLHREIAELIRETLADPTLSDHSGQSVAVFARKAADLLKADSPSFSYEWFFGACGLDNWGSLMDGAELPR